MLLIKFIIIINLIIVSESFRAQYYNLVKNNVIKSTKIRSNNLIKLHSTNNLINKYTNIQNLNLSLIGISHKTASIDQIEKFVIPKEKWENFCTELYKNNIINEITILSTCNRFELYLVSEKNDQCANNVLDFIQKQNDDFKCIKDNLYVLTNEEAIAHIFKVAAGLDSLIIGEDQILSQVKKSNEFIKKLSFGSKLNFLPKLFEYAINTGKKVHQFRQSQ